MPDMVLPGALPPFTLPGLLHDASSDEARNEVSSAKETTGQHRMSEDRHDVFEAVRKEIRKLRDEQRAVLDGHAARVEEMLQQQLQRLASLLKEAASAEHGSAVILSLPAPGAVLTPPNKPSTPSGSPQAPIAVPADMDVRSNDDDSNDNPFAGFKPDGFRRQKTVGPAPSLSIGPTARQSLSKSLSLLDLPNSSSRAKGFMNWRRASSNSAGENSGSGRSSQVGGGAPKLSSVAPTAPLTVNVHHSSPKGAMAAASQLGELIADAHEKEEVTDLTEASDAIGTEKVRDLPVQAAAAQAANDHTRKMSRVSDSASDEVTEPEEHVDSDDEQEQEHLEWKQDVKDQLANELKEVRGLGVRGKTGIVGAAGHHGHGHGSPGRVLYAANRPLFNVGVSILVLVNSAVIGAETHLSMTRALQDVHVTEAFRPVHQAFAALFAIELAWRIAANRAAFFVGSGRGWNLFDTVLVVSSIFEEAADGLGVGGANVSFLRVIRGARVFRVLRLLRVIRLVPELTQMVSSIFHSCMPFIWALQLLFVLTYLAAVIFMQGSVNFLHETPPYQVTEEYRLELVKWWRTLPRSFVTLVMCITGGVDWYEVVQPLSTVGWVYETMFLLYMLFMVIGVLNVLTGIFVQRAQELSGLDRDLVIQAEMKRNRAFLAEMKGIFMETDKDGSGRISWEEFRDFVKNPEVKAYLATQQLDTTDARQLFDALELESSQEVGMEEFIMGCMRLKGLAKSVDLVALLQESRKNNRRVKDVLSDFQDQINLIAGNLGVSLPEDYNPRGSTRRPSCARTNSRRPSMRSMRG